MPELFISWARAAGTPDGLGTVAAVQERKLGVAYIRVNGRCRMFLAIYLALHQTA